MRGDELGLTGDDLVTFTIGEVAPRRGLNSFDHADAIARAVGWFLPLVLERALGDGLRVASDHLGVGCASEGSQAVFNLLLDFGDVAALHPGIHVAQHALGCSVRFGLDLRKLRLVDGQFEVVGHFVPSSSS